MFKLDIVGALTDIITGRNDVQSPDWVYRTGTEIKRFFLDCGVSIEITPSRTEAVQNCLKEIVEKPANEKTIKEIIEKACSPSAFSQKPTATSNVINHINSSLVRYNLKVTHFQGKAIVVELPDATQTVTKLIDKIERFSFHSVQRDIARALENVDRDPEDAITAASSLLEALCRSILVELKLDLPAGRQLKDQLRAVEEALDNLTPVPKRIAGETKQILGCISSVIEGISKLRTQGGDAHGDAWSPDRIDPKFSRFALNVSAAAAIFIIERWEDSQKSPLVHHKV